MNNTIIVNVTNLDDSTEMMIVAGFTSDAVSLCSDYIVKKITKTRGVLAALR